MARNKLADHNNDLFDQLQRLGDKELTIQDIQKETIAVSASTVIKSAKICPICKEVKTLDNFYRYFNKPTNKFMHTTYCDPCAKIKRSVTAKRRYLKNRTEVLIKVKKYRQENAEKIREYEARNKDRIKKVKSEYRKKYIKNLATPYVAGLIAQRKKCSVEEVYQSPELIQAYKNRIIIKRQNRNYGTK